MYPVAPVITTDLLAVATETNKLSKSKERERIVVSEDERMTGVPTRGDEPGDT
jgi:hypothetical protein